MPFAELCLDVNPSPAMYRPTLWSVARGLPVAVVKPADIAQSLPEASELFLKSIVGCRGRAHKLLPSQVSPDRV